GNWTNNRGAISLSATLAMVNSAAKGIQRLPMDTARCNFHPYHQPCHPDLLQCASVSMEVWGTTPASRSFLCQPPPCARTAVLSQAAPWPCCTQGLSALTRERPSRPIRLGKVAGKVAKRRSQVRRGGKPPRPVSQGRRVLGPRGPLLTKGTKAPTA